MLLLLCDANADADDDNAAAGICGGVLKCAANGFIVLYMYVFGV